MSTREIIYAAAGASGPPVYIEDVFSTWLYTGTSATQTITNGIDLSGKGGIVWTKSRSNTSNQYLVYSDNSTLYGLYPNLTNAAGPAGPPSGHVFNNNGFTIDGSSGLFNFNGYTYASWTFRKQPKFFDVVTYTGDGTSSRMISHSLGSQPGFVVVKCTSTTSDWNCRQIGLGSAGIKLNTTAASENIFASYNTDVTSTQFKVYKTSPTYASWSTNESGETYVAYLFAHNAGGFGAAGTDNVISCGSYTYSGGANPEINLGFEPQWVMRKRSDSTSNWEMVDIMRGMPNNTANAQPALQANLSSAESSTSMYILPTATGFIDANCANSSTYIYMAIRRGPMKTPTSGTSVFVPDAAGENASANGLAFDSTFTADWHFRKERNGANSWFSNSRLIPGNTLTLNTTNAETTNRKSVV